MKKHLFGIFLLFCLPFSVWSQCSRIDSLQAALAISKDNQSRINILNRLGHELLREPGNAADKTAREAYQLAEESKYTQGLAEASILMGDVVLRADSSKNYERALNYYQKALSLYGSLNLKPQLASAYEKIGKFYYDYFFINEENYKKSLEHYEKALKIRQETNNALKIAEDTEMIGELYSELHEDKKSVEFLNKALEMKKTLGKRVGSDVRLLEKANQLAFYESRYDRVYSLFWITLVSGLLAVSFVMIFFTERARLRVEKVAQLNRQIKEQNEALIGQKEILEKEKSLNSRFNFLPQKLYDELHDWGHVKPRQYNDASILFADLEDFTSISKGMETQKVMDELNISFNKFDEIIQKYHLTKLKTFGDSYMCAGGMPDNNPYNPVEIILAALEMIRFIDSRRAEKNANGELYWKLRIGINTGFFVAGVIGDQKLTFDVLGETVNIAKLMEINSHSSKVNISEFTYDYVKDYFDFEAKNVEMKIKHKDYITEYIVSGIKPAFSVDGAGIEPNQILLETLKKR